MAITFSDLNGTKLLHYFANIYQTQMEWLETSLN